MSTEEVEILIIGGGPTGLGAALRSEEAGCDWRLLEAADRFGGLASSWVDQEGFTWDLGGHVQFSHYDTFDRYMDAALGPDGWLRHQRESWVWIRGRWVPYPFQNNLYRLDAEDRWRCVEGLLGAGIGKDGLNHASNMRPTVSNFGEWIDATFGRGISELFMRPYNRKVWAYEPKELDFRWIGERVSVPDLKRVLRSICMRTDDVSWGPNAMFRFPRQGGTGAIWENLGRSLPSSRVALGAEIVQVHPEDRTAVTADGESLRYRYLISTTPLDTLIKMAPGVVAREIAGRLRYSSTTVVGVGVAGKVPEHLATKCWMYFPESNSPYYRVTVFSNYSPHNVAVPGEQWSLMAEIASPSDQLPEEQDVTEKTLRALQEDALLPQGAELASVVCRQLNQGYPTPFLGRDGIVDPVLRALEEKGIYSRGRFGAWKYEVSNQDHSFAQGYECVERCLSGGGPECEPTLFTPHLVNGRRNP